MGYENRSFDDTRNAEAGSADAINAAELVGRARELYDQFLSLTLGKRVSVETTTEKITGTVSGVILREWVDECVLYVTKGTGREVRIDLTKVSDIQVEEEKKRNGLGWTQPASPQSRA